MKLAKKISARITFCTILSIFTCIIWGGVTSCSNGSDDPERIPNSDVPQGWTEIIVGDIEKYNGQDGSTAYSVTKNGDGSITISHDGAMGKYASCSFKPNFGENNTLYTKITNNSDVAATVQVQVNKAGTKDNNYEPMPTVTAVYVDKEKRSDASEYSVELKIDANTSVVIANMFDTAKSPNTVAISLNSQESVAGEVSKGNITVSGVSMKKITDESELGTLTGGDSEPEDPGKDEGGETTPPETAETVLYTLDFSGAEPPKNHYSTNDENAKFVPNEGVQLKTAWKEFAIVTDNMNLIKDATHVKVNFKCSDDATFAEGDKDNNKFMIGVYKQDETYNDTNISWTCFLKGGEDAFPKDYKTVEKAVTWEQKYTEDGNPIPDVDFSKDISGFRIWDCNFTSGTLTVKSIEFIKK